MKFKIKNNLIFLVPFALLFGFHITEAALWTPAEISTNVWFDASDATTITQSSGQVSQWRTKTGSNHLNQASSTLQAIWGTEFINGLNTVKFDGVDDRMSLTQTTIVRGGLTKTLNEIWAVVHMSDITEETIFGNSSADLGYATIGAGASMLASNGVNNPYGPNNTSTTTVGTTTAHVLGFIGDLNKKYSINGTLETKTDTVSTNSANLIRVNQIGFRTGGAFNGTMGELIIKPISSTDNRRRMEGYLAWKWGTQGNLPDDHIYKNTAPTTDQYTLTFDSDGGSAVASITDVFGTTVVAPTPPTKTEATFLGWDPVLPSTIPSSNQTYTAQWDVNQYTLSFDSDGGTAVSPITDDYDAVITTPAPPTKLGYTFAGWNPALPSNMPAGDQTYTAIWTIEQFALTFNTRGGNIINAIVDDFGATITMPADPIRSGYAFGGWSPEIPSTMPATNQVHIALWDKISSNKGGTSIQGRIQNLLEMGNIERATELSEQYNGVLPTTIPALQVLLAQLQAQLAELLAVQNQEDTCKPISFTKPIRLGSDNNPVDVKKLEQFLNTYEQADLDVDGVYSQIDFDTVVKWQEKYQSDILTPWGETKGTGYVFTTSLKKLNEISYKACAPTNL